MLVERQGKSNAQVVEQFLTKYARALAAHRMDAVLQGDGSKNVE